MTSTPIASFAAVNSNDFLLTTIFTGITIVGLILSWWFLRPKKQRTSKQRNLYNLLAMLAFFASIIAGSTAFFSAWNYQRNKPIQIFEDHLTLNKKEIPYSKIANARIEENPQRSMVNKSIVKENVHLLLIDIKDAPSIVLSEKEYPIDKIFEALKASIDQWKKT